MNLPKVKTIDVEVDELIGTYQGLVAQTRQAAPAGSAAAIP
jgi:hypothetical protein